MWVFIKAQISSLSATLIDFMVTILLVELAAMRPLLATVAGAVAGALFNFFLNKYWSFDTGKLQLRKQGLRYALVWAGSVVLNTGGLYLLTQFSSLGYVPAKITAAIIVGIGFNYTLQKKYVFNTHEEALNS